MRKFNGKKAGIICGVALASFTSYALLDTFVIPHPMQTVSGQNLDSSGLSINEEESTEAENAYAANQDQDGLSSNNSGQSGFNQDDSGQNRFKQDGYHQDGENNENYDENSSNQSFGGNGGFDNGQGVGGHGNGGPGGHGQGGPGRGGQGRPGSTSSTSSGTVIGTYSDSKSKITVTQYRAYDSNIYVADVEVTDGTSILSAFANNTYGRNITDTTSDMAEENNAVLAINGDYYGARQSGYVIRNGVVYRNQGSNGEDMVISKDGSLSFVSESDTTTDSLIQKQAWQVLSFGPVLVENGQVAVSENEVRD